MDDGYFRMFSLDGTGLMACQVSALADPWLQMFCPLEESGKYKFLLINTCALLRLPLNMLATLLILLL